ncbi:MAG: hypothetical protein GY793_04100 [Proteobacteria bacterium]|nr:hypothetical protein [Pseudomonadota bacterium]
MNTHYPLFFILAIVLGYAYRDLESRVDDEDLSITEEARRTQKNVTVLIYVCLSGILCFTFRLN